MQKKSASHLTTYYLLLTTMRYLFFATFLLLLLASCGSSEEETYRPNIDKTPEVKTSLVRFDKLLLDLDTTQLEQGMAQLQAAHPDFSNLFFNNIIAPDRSGNPVLSLAAFLSFPDTRLLLDTIQQVYPDFGDLQKQINTMLRYKSYYFPKDKQKLDTIYTFASLYNYGYGVYENYIVIGLDYFLGEQHFIYNLVPNLKPLYIRRTLNKAHLVRGVALAVATDLVERNTTRSGNKMIDYMLYEGKKYYLTRAFLPETPDSIIFAFSDAQMAYCSQPGGERSLYDYLLKEQLFYSDKYETFRKYVEIGPFNPSNALYGNSGSWLGSRMVEQYIAAERKNGKLTDAQIVAKMLAESDAQAFFKRFKPRK